MRIAQGKSLTDKDKAEMQRFALWLTRSVLCRVLRARAGIAGR